MKLTLLSFVLAASLVTALPREYGDVKKVAKFDQRSLINAHGDFNVAGIEPMAKRAPDDLDGARGDAAEGATGDVGDATKGATDDVGDDAKGATGAQP